MHRKILKASQYVYPSTSPMGLCGQLLFIKKAFSHRRVLRSFVQEIYSLGYPAIFDHEIPVVGALVWPYIHKDWDVAKRFATILGHYQLLKTQPAFLDVTNGQAKVILDLDQYSAGTAIVLDKAQWFVREGEVVMNLFKDGQRMMSLAFTLAKLNHQLVIYVGAIQGIHANDQSHEHFKTMTKDFEGLRPRDLLIEVLRMIAQKIGAYTILGITDEDRHHRHPYFANNPKIQVKANYNAAWLEQQAVFYGEGFYAVPVTKQRKDLAEVDSKKRAMYRRRYEMLDHMDAMIQVLMALPTARSGPKIHHENHHYDDILGSELGLL